MHTRCSPRCSCSDGRAARAYRQPHRSYVDGHAARASAYSSPLLQGSCWQREAPRGVHLSGGNMGERDHIAYRQEKGLAELSSGNGMAAAVAPCVFTKFRPRRFFLSMMTDQTTGNGRPEATRTPTHHQGRLSLSRRTNLNAKSACVVVVCG